MTLGFPSHVRIGPVACLLSVLVTTCFADRTVTALAAQRETPVFTAIGELVRLDVVVVGSDGQPVEGLEDTDFEVVEHGKRLAVGSFEAIALEPSRRRQTSSAAPVISSSHPFDPAKGQGYLIFFDDVHISPQVSEWVRATLAPFLEREVKDGDSVTIVAPEENVWWTARTPWEHRQLSKVVQGLFGQLNRNPFGDELSEYTAMQLVERGSRTGASGLSRGLPEAPSSSNFLIQEMTYAVAQRRIRRTLATLEQAVRSLAGLRGRKTLFLYSEGFIRADALGDAYDHVVESARRANVMVQFIAPQGLRSGRADAAETAGMSCGDPKCLDTEAGGSTYLAVKTGGRVFFSNDVTAPIRETLTESSVYYLLGFRPPNDKPGEHRVRVRVRRKGLRVQGRERYFLPGSDQDSGGLAALLAADLRSAADESGVSLEVAAAARGSVVEGRRPVRIVAEFGTATLETTELRFAVTMELRSLAGGKSVRASGEVSVPARREGRGRFSRMFELEPGIWQARVVVWEARGKVASATHSFAVQP
jgi:VWFA-related protein